ncbi:MAG: Obg family GTPase CgtA [SAR86 cluster bacterium]|nr:MAG: Obg family GTPase CgtA [SAR86 cluster bacterium]|tara:strand:+ start:388 stop:1386 length:999 start_codon:yes stop_codon:yes gene_type:complete
MNYIDEAFLEVRAGSGGSGASSFRREKYIPFGGPDGGDGGKGGDVFFKANENKNTLVDFQNKKLFEAKNGKSGSGKNKSGSAGSDLIIEVPLGTVIYDEELQEELLDCCDKDKTYLIAKGGDGGQGNARFKTSTNQAPRKFTKGFEGEKRVLRLELRSLANVGLVGFPNAGKSTFLRKVSSAKPKIGNYPFTTLRPNLGTVKTSYSSFVIADIPGLIEGASEGAGLGIKFLQHISRTGLLLIFIDLSPDVENNPINQIKLLKKELSLYKNDLTQKEMWVVLNKEDISDKKSIAKFEDEIKNKFNFSKKQIYSISSLTGNGVDKLISALAKKV